MYDVIVIGAGPAGASAAYYLAKAGLKVLLLEKHKLPRFKPCAGGISQKILDTLPEAVQRTRKATVNYNKFFFQMSDPFLVELERPMAMVDRQEFDQILVAEAVKAGAEIIDNIKIAEIIIGNKDVRLVTDNNEYEACYLIGADGTYSQVSRAAGLCRKRQIRAGLEVEIPNEEYAPNIVYFSFGQVRDGYAWLFPKTNYVSVGITGRPTGKLASELDRWLKFLNLKTEEQKIYSYPLPEVRPGEQLQKGRILLIGDAAGLVDPFTGEGIRYAIRSARLAAEVIVKQELNEYSKRIYQEISSDFIYAYRLRWLFYNWPGLSYRFAVKSFAVNSLMLSIINGEATYEALYKKTVNPFALLKRSVS